MDAPCSRRFAAAAATVLMLAFGCAAGPAPASASQDPLVSQQWAFGRHDPLGAREAWGRSTGAGVVVAVIDSGVQLDHPDLKDNLWTNPGEVVNGLDDDGNGYVDDVHGANMLDGSSNVTDDVGHGTHVAGIIAARAGNGIGGTGVAPRARIMVVKVHSAALGATVGTLARGIRYAVDEGAKILNVSLNGDATTPGLNDAVRYAGAHGATVVAAAGNDGRDIDAHASYPAALPDPAILSVTATSESGSLMDISNYGRRAVDLAAPGDMIVSTAIGSDYELRAGTSMAAPFVSGALALLAAARPELSQPQLRAALLAGAAHTPRLAGRVGAGGLDVGAAMHRIVPGTWGHGGVRARVRLRAPARAHAGARATVRWSATRASAVTRWSVSLDGHRVRTLSKRQAHSAQTRVGRAGRHTWRVTGYDARAHKVVSAARSFRAVR